MVKGIASSRFGPLASLMNVLTICIEVEYQRLAEQRFRSAYEAIERLCSSKNNVDPYQCYLIQHAQALKLRNEELTRQREELSRIEGEADIAAKLSYQTDVSILLID